MTDADRRSKLIELWLERPEEEHTDTGMLNFFHWLVEHHPELLKHGTRDPYQYLKVDLTGHVDLPPVFTRR